MTTEKLGRSHDRRSVKKEIFKVALFSEAVAEL
jgi:hypothetical protein